MICSQRSSTYFKQTHPLTLAFGKKAKGKRKQLPAMQLQIWTASLDHLDNPSPNCFKFKRRKYLNGPTEFPPPGRLTSPRWQPTFGTYRSGGAYPVCILRPSEGHLTRSSTYRASSVCCPRSVSSSHYPWLIEWIVSICVQWWCRCKHPSTGWTGNCFKSCYLCRNEGRQAGKCS